MPSAANQAWNLESFLDSLIVELDKAQDTLSFKGITRRLTYTVKDVGLDLQIFPQYDGRKVKFVTAQPGDAGASKISIQLGRSPIARSRRRRRNRPAKTMSPSKTSRDSTPRSRIRSAASALRRRTTWSESKSATSMWRRS